MTRLHTFAASLLYLSYAASVAAASVSPAVGSIAPDFKAHNLVTRESMLLSSQRGKIVILTFWASWCAPCRRELPYCEHGELIFAKNALGSFQFTPSPSPITDLCARLQYAL